MEAKKKKIEQIIELKKKTWCNYCNEKRHWERECKNKEDDEKEDNTIANVAKNGKYLINIGLVVDASSEELLFA